ncbi:hypothetical protein SNK03_010604 [Fusarium graminearum]
MSDPVHPFSLTNGTGDIRFTLPGSNQEWTTRIQRPGEEQVNNNPSNNTPMERQASRRPQHDMLPQQHGQFVQQPQHGRRPSSTRGSTTNRDNDHHVHGHSHHHGHRHRHGHGHQHGHGHHDHHHDDHSGSDDEYHHDHDHHDRHDRHGHGHHGQGHHQFNAPPQYVMAAPEGHMPPGRQMAPPGYGIARVPAPQGSGRAPLGHQMAFTEHLRRGQEMTPLGVPRHVIDNADSEMMEFLLGTPRRPKWESTMAADMEALGLNTPERQRRGQEMTPLGVPRHVIDNADSETIQSLLGIPRRPKWKSTMAADIEELNRLRRNR